MKEMTNNNDILHLGKLPKIALGVSIPIVYSTDTWSTGSHWGVNSGLLNGTTMQNRYI